MKELTLEIVSNIVSNPSDVEVLESEEDGTKILTIIVNPEDISRVIGKEGRIIRSLRNILRIAAIKRGERVFIKLQDDNGPAHKKDQETETSAEE